MISLCRGWISSVIIMGLLFFPQSSWGGNDNEKKQQYFTVRPLYVEREIGKAFQKLASKTQSDWGINGSAHPYYLLGANEFELIKKQIKHAPESQKKKFCFRSWRR